MNVEKWEGEEASIENRPWEEEREDRYGEADLGGRSIAGYMMDEWAVDIADARAMLDLFRKLSRKGKSEELARLHNLYREWREEQDGKNVE